MEEGKEGDISAPNLLGIVINNDLLNAQLVNVAMDEGEAGRIRINPRNFLDDNLLIQAGERVNITQKPQMAARVPEILAKYAETQYFEMLHYILPVLSRTIPTVKDIEIMLSYKLFKNFTLYNILQPGMFIYFF